MTETYDVVVIGGGAAGLSAGVALARFRRSVLVVGAGEPRNARSRHVHNFLTRDGISPAELYAIGRAEVIAYGGEILDAHASAVRPIDHGGFGVDVGERSVTARRVLVATGLRDELPQIHGLAERWGVDVLHCPYCHGWEVRDRRVGVLATGPAALHQALLFRQLTKDVTMLQHTAAAFDEDQTEQLLARGITVVAGRVGSVEATADGLTGVRLADGRTVALDALVVAPRFTARADLLAPLGLEPVDVLMGDHPIGTRIEADPSGATTVPGLWVAGNVTDLRAQVMTSANAGLMTAAAINADLVAQDTRQAVQAHRFERVYGEAAWDDRYRAAPQTWSGNPNPVLVDEIADLPAGSALDAGSGEGGDAIWLAGRGWAVTGVELSQVALSRAATRAAEMGRTITWAHLDLTTAPAPDTYDLVSAFFLHLPLGPRRRMFSHLRDAVAWGGTLLVVGHDPSDAHVVPRHNLAEMGWTADELAAELGPGWTVEVAEARPRAANHPDGRAVTIHDAVLRARRNG